MRCTYCGAEVTNYPENGICQHCGGKLPERPAGIRCAACGTYSIGNFCSHCGRPLNGSVPPVQPLQPPQPIVQPVYIPVQQAAPRPGINCCPNCYNMQLTSSKRGFRWGLAILGFFLIPGFGLLLGFCGSKKIRSRCQNCGYKWIHN